MFHLAVTSQPIHYDFWSEPLSTRAGIVAGVNRVTCATHIAFKVLLWIIYKQSNKSKQSFLSMGFDASLNPPCALSYIK